MQKRVQEFLIVAVISFLFASCGGGGTSTPPPNGNGNGNPLPTVISISPASGTVGGAGFTLTVTGSNFVSGTVVNWAGAALTTTFVSSTSVTAAIPASDLNTAGTAQVIVTNPTPGGGSSAAKTFNINNPAPAVTSLSQTNANAGSSDFTLTVTGSGFVSTSVVNWNGSARTTTFGSGTQLTASISASDLSIAGSAHVSVSNPTPGGGSSSNLTFTITPQIANGNALPGDPNSLAVDATSDVPPVSVDSSQVQNGVIMTRLDIRFAKDATVAQVNGALAAIGAGIVSMSHGFTSVTIGIPSQNSFDTLNTLVAQLEESPGILFAGIGYVPQTRRVFPGSPTLTTEQDISHLLPARFPAAWNLLPANIVGDPANDTVLRSCPFSSVPVVVTDVFSKPVPSNFRALVPSAGEPDDPDQGFGTQHGYSVTEVLNAAAFGANPFPYSGCNDIQLVQLGKNITPTQQVDLMVNGMPGNERFIVSRSMGYPDQCAASPCVPPRDVLDRPLARANGALYWKEKTFDRWSNFLMVVAAGNERNAESTSIYPATGDSRFDDFVNIGQLTDKQFQFVNDDSLWTPSTTKIAQGFLSLKPTDAEQVNLQQAIAGSLSAGQAVADNVIVVGATTNQPLTQQALQNQHFTPDQLTESVFSDSNPDVFAVGQDIFGTGNNGLNGTSFSTPQVAGLASYLWMLSPDLRNFQPISATKNAIVANTRNKFIDAYASALSLDGAITPQTAPMRLALLDLNGNGRFDDVDVDKFLHQFFTVDPNGNILDTSAGGPADFSRFDLNGDGFTTGFSGLRERFDLDRVGSVQYGASQYSSVTEKIEDLDTQFDENAISDLDILCYYAYSPMYQGDIDARKTLLGGRCGLAVTPAKVTLVPGQTQKFTANTPANDPVTWSASCGSIDATGNYTAGNDVGPCTVRATDTPHPTISGTAEVTLITGTFGAETGYTAEVLGIDFVTGNEIFPQQILSASNTSSTLKPGPLDAASSGSYQQPGNFQPVIYSVSAHAEGPIVERGVTPSSGTFTSTISCTADGDSKKNSDDSVTLPFMPALTVSSGGALEFSVPPGGLTVSVSGTLTRGATKGVTDGKLFMTGDAFFDTIDAGGPDQSVEFDLNDGQQSSGNSPSSVPFSKTMHVSQPGGFDVHWQLTARCFAGAGAETGLHIARNATVTFTYTASQ